MQRQNNSEFVFPTTGISMFLFLQERVLFSLGEKSTINWNIIDLEVMFLQKKKIWFSFVWVSQEEIMELKEAFDLFDNDKSGSILQKKRSDQ